ncbi:hypothetical protein ACWDA3_55900 [Nonomuraea rubra]
MAAVAWSGTDRGSARHRGLDGGYGPAGIVRKICGTAAAGLAAGVRRSPPLDQVSLSCVDPRMWAGLGWPGVLAWLRWKPP